jgi:hypothetical protein
VKDDEGSKKKKKRDEEAEEGRSNRCRKVLLKRLPEFETAFDKDDNYSIVYCKKETRQGVLGGYNSQEEGKDTKILQRLKKVKSKAKSNKVKQVNDILEK